MHDQAEGDCAAIPKSGATLRDGGARLLRATQLLRLGEWDLCQNPLKIRSFIETLVLIYCLLRHLPNVPSPLLQIERSTYLPHTEVRLKMR